MYHILPFLYRVFEHRHYILLMIDPTITPMIIAPPPTIIMRSAPRKSEIFESLELAAPSRNNASIDKIIDDGNAMSTGKNM